MRGRMRNQENNMKKTIIASLIGAAFTTPIYAADAVNFNDIIVTASRTPVSYTHLDVYKRQRQSGG